MLSRWVGLLFVTIALAGCCMSGSGCYAPVAPGGPVAWDGLGSVPTEDGAGDNKPRRTASPKNEIIVGPLNGQVTGQVNRQVAPPGSASQAKDWDQQQVTDQQADVQLNSQLKICRGC
jgi:hypothetical protein